MSAAILAAGIWPTTAALRAADAPLLERYAVPLDNPRLFRFVVGATDADDGQTSLAPHNGGGRWIAVRQQRYGTPIIDEDTIITVGDGQWHTVAENTLTAPRTLTLSVANARRGDMKNIFRIDSSVHVLAIVNGGLGGGTIVELPGGQRSYVTCWFDGTDWGYLAAGLML